MTKQGAHLAHVAYHVGTHLAHVVYHVGALIVGTGTITQGVKGLV